MARDISILPSGKQTSYEQLKTSLGETEADTWFDSYTSEMGIVVPQTEPQVSAIPETVQSITPSAEPAEPAEPAVQPVVEQSEFKPPTPTEITARLGVGEFAPKTTEADIAGEEYKSLEAQTKRFVDAGVPTKGDVGNQITVDLQNEGIDILSPEFWRRYEEELGRADYAEKRAMAEVAPARQPLTADLVPAKPIATPQTIAKDPSQVEQMGGFEAIGRAFLPQEMESPAETVARQQAESNRIQLEESSKELAASKGISQEDAKKEILKGIQTDFYYEAVDEIGLTTDTKAVDEEATKKYLQYLQTNLPDEYALEIQRNEEVDIYRLLKMSEKEIKFRKQLEMSATDAALGALSFLASDKYDPEVYKEVKQKLGLTPETEAVVESLPMTIVRDLAGLSRFIFNPLTDVAMYDVVPGTDTKINPDEWGFIPREITGRKEEEAWGKTYISSDAGIDGSLKEIAVEIATARSFGDDLASQQAVRPEDESLIRGIGILGEVVMPLNVFSVPGKIAGATARGGRSLAKTMKLTEVVPGSVAEIFGDIAKVGEALENPLQIGTGLYNAIVVDNKLIKPLQAAAKKSGLLADELGKSTKLADALVDSNKVSVIEAARAGDRYTVLGVISKGPEDLLTNPIYAGIVNRLEKISPEIVSALKRTEVGSPKKMATKVLDEAGKSGPTYVKSVVRLVDSTVKEIKPLAAGVNIKQVSPQFLDAERKAIRTAMQESLADSLLGQWSFVTPNIVISTKLAKSKGTSGKTVVQELAEKIKLDMEDMVDFTGDIFKLKKEINVKQLLQDSLVSSTTVRMKFYEEAFKKAGQTLKAGDTLTPDQYRYLNTLVAEASIGKQTRAGELGAFKASTTGRAFQSASDPAELRSSIIQYGKQLKEESKKAAGKILNKTFVKAPVKRYVSDITTQYAGWLESFPAQLSNTISQLGKGGSTSNEILGEVLSKALNQTLGAVDLSTVVPTLRSPSARKALREVMEIQFNLPSSKTPQGKAIYEMIDEFANTAFSNPSTNAKLFYDKARGVRDEIVKRFPELLDQEVVAQGAYFARGARRDSLPDTILSYASKITKDKGLKDIVERNRNLIYDNNAVALFDATDTGITKAEIIKATNAGLVKQLDGGSADDIIQAIKDAGISEITVDIYGDIFIQTINDYAIDIMRGTLGFTSADGAEVIRRLNLTLQQVETGVLAYLPDAASNDIKNINASLRALNKNPVKRNAVISTINEVERQVPGLFAKIAGDMKSFAGLVHKNIAEGMLAGKVIPNVTYLSENVFTAPLIAAVTNPEYIGTVLKNVPKMAAKTTTGLVGGEFGRFGGYTSDLYQPAISFPNKVAIVTPQGERITNAELWRLFTEARIGAGQAEAVLRPQAVAQLKELSRLAGKDNTLLMKSAAKRFKDFAPSSTASIPMTVAQNTDMAFRQALFKEAIRRGSTPAEAAAIARETLLDYGLLDNLLPQTIRGLKEPFMFLSFATSMSAAILKGALRGETAENILRMARFHKDMSKYSGVYAPGQAELESLYVEQQQQIGEKPATYVYMRDPIMGQIFWMANIANSLSYFIRGGESNDATGLEPLETFEKFGYSPYIQFVSDIAGAYSKSFVPARQIAFGQTTGMWPWMQSNFNIEEVPLEKMRRGEPTFEGKQYRFKTVAGKRKYITTMAELTLAGWNRTTNDYLNAAIAAGAAPEGAYLARYYPENPAFEGIQADPSLKGFVNGLLYMIVRQRASRPPTQIEVFDLQMQTEMRKLKDLQLEDVEE